MPRHAPWHSVPDVQVFSIEHPFIIQNKDRIAKSLGGEQKIAEVHDAFSQDPSLAWSPSFVSDFPAVDCVRITTVFTVPLRAARRSLE